MVRNNANELRLRIIEACGELIDHYRLMDPSLQLFNHRDPVALANLELYAKLMEMREGHYNRLLALAELEEGRTSAHRAKEVALSFALTLLAILLMLPVQLACGTWKLLVGGR